MAWLYSVSQTAELIGVDKSVPLFPSSFITGNLGQCYTHSFAFSVTGAENLCQKTCIKLFSEHGCVSDGCTSRLQLGPAMSLAGERGVCRDWEAVLTLPTSPGTGAEPSWPVQFKDAWSWQWHSLCRKQTYGYRGFPAPLLIVALRISWNQNKENERWKQPG